jgi:hypothetical protein
VTAVGHEVLGVVTCPGKGVYSPVYRVAVLLGGATPLVHVAGEKVTVATVGLVQTVSVAVPSTVTVGGGVVPVM